MPYDASNYIYFQRNVMLCILHLLKKTEHNQYASKTSLTIKSFFKVSVNLTLFLNFQTLININLFNL